MQEKVKNKVTSKDVFIFFSIAWICSCFPLLFINKLEGVNWFKEYADFIYGYIPSIQYIVASSENPTFAKLYLACMWLIAPILGLSVGYVTKDTGKRAILTHIFILFMIFFSAYAAIYWKVFGVVLPQRISEQIILYGGGLRIICIIGAGFLLLTTYLKFIKNNYLSNKVKEINADN